MGKLLIIGAYVFLVFSSDIHELRRHIHVQIKQGKHRNGLPLCKFWLEPEIELAYNHGIPETEITAIKAHIHLHCELIHQQLDEFYAGRKVNIITLPNL